MTENFVFFKEEMYLIISNFIISNVILTTEMEGTLINLYTWHTSIIVLLNYIYTPMILLMLCYFILLISIIIVLHFKLFNISPIIVYIIINKKFIL